MCYYNSIKISKEQFIKIKEFEKAITDRGLVNQLMVSGFDYSRYPVLKKTGKPDFEIAAMEWGFLPPYLNSGEDVVRFRQGYKKKDGSWQRPILTLNAKGEELLKPEKMFRDAALNRRCLVLSSGFYEWRHVYYTSRRTGVQLKSPQKIPYYITLKDKEYFFMAGIWQSWKDKSTGEYAETFAIVTTEANSLMAQIHNSKKRMPVLLPEDLACEWLLGNPDEKRIIDIANFQINPEQMSAYTISKDFRESGDPVSPAVYSGLPPERN